MNFGPQTKLEVQGKARHKAARRRNSECKIVEIPSQQWQSVGLQRSGDLLAARHIGRCAAPPANHRLMPLPREEFRLFCARNCGAGRPHVGLCPAHLVCLFVDWFVCLSLVVISHK